MYGVIEIIKYIVSFFLKVLKILNINENIFDDISIVSRINLCFLLIFEFLAIRVTLKFLLSCSGIDLISMLEQKKLFSCFDIFSLFIITRFLRDIN